MLPPLTELAIAAAVDVAAAGSKLGFADWRGFGDDTFSAIFEALILGFVSW